MAWGSGRLPGMDAVLATRGWMVSVPPTMSPDGQRRRRYFSAERERRRRRVFEGTEFSKGQANLLRKRFKRLEVERGN